MQKLFYILFLLTFILGCDEPPSQIVIENKANMDIYAYPSNNYPDTSIDVISESILKGYNAFYVRMFEEKTIEGVAYCDENIWNTYVPNDTLIIYIFDKNLVDRTTFDTIVDNYMIYKRYNITFEELILHKCKVVVE